MLELGLTAGILIIIFLSVCGSLVFGKLNAKFRCISIMLAAVAAFVVALIVKSNFTSEELVVALTNTLQTIEQTDISTAIAQLSDAALTLLSVIGSITAPLLFFIFFIIFSIVAFLISVLVWFVKVIVTPKEKKRNGFLTRVITGAISGLVVAICILIPISTYSRVIAIALPELENHGAIEKDSNIAKTVTAADNNTAVQTFRDFGGTLLTDTLTNITLTDDISVTTVKLTDETANLAQLYAHIATLSEKELKEYSEAEADTILAIGEDFAHSRLITKLSCETLYAVSGAWINGDHFLGIPKPDLGDNFNPAFDELLAISNSDSQTSTYLGEDITTIARLVSKLASAGIFAKLDSEPTEIIHTLTEDRVIGDIISTLNENQRMRSLIPILSNIGLTVISDSIGIPEDKQEVYSNMMNDIASELNSTVTLPEEERTAKIAEVICATTHDAGIDVAEAEANILASSLIQYFGTSQTASAAEIAKFFTEVGEAMAASNTENIAYVTGGSTIKLGDSYSPSEAAGKLLGSLFEASKIPDEAARKAAITNAINSSELYSSYSDAAKASIADLAANTDITMMASSFENITSLFSEETAVANITKITLNDIIFDLSVYANSTASIDEINANMTNIFKNAAIIAENLSLLSDIEKSAESFKTVSDSLGKILDILALNDFYGKNRAHDLFEAIISSHVISDATNLTRAEIDKLIHETTGISKYSSIIGVMADITSVAEGVTNNNIENEHIQSMIGNLDHESVVVVDTLLNEEKLGDMGFKPKDPEKSTEVVHALFDELAHITNEEQFETEANAVEHLLELATIATHVSKEDQVFGDGGALGVTAEQVIEELHLSSAVCNTFEKAKEEAGVNPFNIDMNEDDKAAFSKACDDYLKNNPTEEALKFIENTKAFFDLQ